MRKPVSDRSRPFCDGSVVELEETRDMELIRSVVTDPRVYPHVTDDYSPCAMDWRPIDNPRTIYLAVKVKGETLGLLVLIKQNSICWKLHVCMLPKGYGKIAIEAMRKTYAWVWQNTPCRRIIGEVPKHNRRAFWFALRAGMRIFAVNPGSWLWKGAVEDLILFGISRPGGAACL